MTPDEANQVLADTQRHIVAMEIVRIKEGLWKVALHETRKLSGAPLPESVFENAITMLRTSVTPHSAAVPGFDATLQDAISEFRTEARRLYMQKWEEE